MKITPDRLIIPESKLTRYLLVWRSRSDKSKFLAQAGFTAENPDALERAIREQAASNEAIEDRIDDYGRHFRIEGLLTGTNGTILDVVTVWNQPIGEDVFRFVTLKPRRSHET